MVITTTNPSVLNVPGVEQLMQYGGEQVRKLLQDLGNLEGNRARLLEVARTWGDASTNAAAANRSFVDDVNPIQHWQAGAADAFKNSYTDMIGKFGQLEPAYKTLGETLKSVADNLAKVNEALIAATVTAVAAIAAAIAALVVTLGGSAGAIPVVIAAWVAFVAALVGLAAKFISDAVTLFNEIKLSGQFVGVRPASAINFEGAQVTVPPVNEWHHTK